MCYVIFKALVEKYYTFAKFCEFKALVEKDNGMKLKVSEAINCGEYVSNEFNKFYTIEGIQQELITPHNP